MIFKTKSVKPETCPYCHAPATDIGTCPYCHVKIGGTAETVHYTYLGKYLNLSYILKKQKNTQKTKYIIVKKKGFHKGEITRILLVKKDKINSFFNYKANYKNNTDASIQIGLKTELNENESAIIGRAGKTIALANINKTQTCECGCKYIAIDNFHGETFCPECGLIHDTNLSSEFLEV